MKVGMIAVTGMFVCASALAEEGFVGLADPTRPASASFYEAVEPVPAGPVLQTVTIAPGVKRAVISGKTYRVGERMGAAVVADIRPYEVILNQEGRETRLRLVPRLEKESVVRPGDRAKE